jgi:hypothetical protein
MTGSANSGISPRVWNFPGLRVRTTRWLHPGYGTIAPIDEFSNEKPGGKAGLIASIFERETILVS